MLAVRELFSGYRRYRTSSVKAQVLTIESPADDGSRSFVKEACPWLSAYDVFLRGVELEFTFYEVGCIGKSPERGKEGDVEKEGDHPTT